MFEIIEINIEDRKKAIIDTAETIEEAQRLIGAYTEDAINMASRIGANPNYEYKYREI